jgi:hypothetical protein
MPRQRTITFTTIRSEGGLLPSDLLARVATQDKSIPGLSTADYHLVKGESLGNRITESWNKLTAAWKYFTEQLEILPDSDQGTTLTRERWLLPLFGELGFGRLQATRALDLDGKSYPVSHGWGKVPIHLISCRTPIDRRSAGVKGAAGASPHSMVQEVLNRSQEHLWAFVSNGLILRILRDNASLTRQAFVEFDLETMMSDGVYEDFVVLWLTCHQSRIEADDPKECWLEKWTKVAAESGTRARDDLRSGVEKAIEALGAGFVAHPANNKLRDRLRSGDLSTHDYYRQLLRVIYRLLFLFVAEDRQLLHPPSAGSDEQRKYARYYSLGRVRAIAGRRRGGPHPDLWSSLVAVFQGLGRPEGIPALGLPGLGSFLWSDAACPDIDQAQIANQFLLAAVRGVGFIEDKDEKVLRPVDYRNLGSEELGAIYESLLEQHPEVNADAGEFSLNTAAGSERKTTGSYYTPTSLITELLNSAVDPVVAEAAAKPQPEAAILSLSVIDPACGSGHFLIAAAHRIAKRLATIRTGDEEPSPDAMRGALRNVIGSCIYGIDLNPMAVELCKVSLWMESMEPGKPLGFLDHRIVRGNGLIGATPKLLEVGVPDVAFKPLTGDDKGYVTSLKRDNKMEREHGKMSLFAGTGSSDFQKLAQVVSEIDLMPDDDVATVQIKATRWSDLVQSPQYQNAVQAADTWCAAFVALKRDSAVDVTHEQFDTAQTSPTEVSPEVRECVSRLASQYAFLHWHLAFPEVFTVSGGFDVVLGNPPWERVKLSEKEFFASRAPEIANLAGAKRKNAIAKLKDDQPLLWDEYQLSLRQAEAESHFIRNSGRYPLCGRGDVNTYAIFAEAMRDAVGPTGRAGLIVPTGIATDDTTKHYFADIVERRQLACLFDFENAVPVFASVHRSFKFCLLTLSGSARPVDEAEFVFFAHFTSDLQDPDRRFTLSPDDLSLINPNTKTTPVFRSRRDAEITRAIYRRMSVLVRDDEPDGNLWGIEFSTMFHMTNDSHHFRTPEELRHESAVLKGNVWVQGSHKWLPLFESKMMWLYDHRSANVVLSQTALIRQGQSESLTVEQHLDPTCTPNPRAWVPAELVASRMLSSTTALLAWRKVTTAFAARSFVSCLLPGVAVGDNLLLAHGSPHDLALLNAVMSSFALDYFARQKLGGINFQQYIAKQLPVPGPEVLNARCQWASRSVREWVMPRVSELTYTSWDMYRLGKDLGFKGPPFRWDSERRSLILAELDAAFFILYELERSDVEYILDTFEIVRRKDEAAHGEYRTKRLILERYDALAAAAVAGTEYQTVLNPPPADPSCAHPESTRPEWA